MTIKCLQIKCFWSKMHGEMLLRSDVHAVEWRKLPRFFPVTLQRCNRIAFRISYRMPYSPQAVRLQLVAVCSCSCSCTCPCVCLYSCACVSSEVSQMYPTKIWNQITFIYPKQIKQFRLKAARAAIAHKYSTVVACEHEFVTKAPIDLLWIVSGIGTSK